MTNELSAITNMVAAGAVVTRQQTMIDLLPRAYIAEQQPGCIFQRKPPENRPSRLQIIVLAR